MKDEGIAKKLLRLPLIFKQAKIQTVGCQHMKICSSAARMLRFGLNSFALATAFFSTAEKSLAHDECLTDQTINIDYIAKRDGSTDVNAALKTTNGRDTYFLNLHPDPDVFHHVVVLQLSLYKGPIDEGSSNLLDPSKHAMGYQKYIFAARDFTRGISNSTYGKNRSIDLVNSGSRVEIIVLKANVKKIADTEKVPQLDYEFDSLSLSVRTNNLPTCK